jgi:glycine hydroxymethyltransferase
MSTHPRRPWVPAATEAWHERVALDVAALDPASLVDEVERLAGRQERTTDGESIVLNAGTNVMNPRARPLLGGSLGTRSSLGYPGDKYETGLADGDRIEVIAVELARTLFHARFVEHRVLSGSMANLCAYMALARPGDAIMVIPSSAAGHATNQAYGAAGLYGLAVHEIPFDAATMNVDLEGLARRAREIRPRVIVVGASLVLFPYDMAAIREIADAVEARVMFDGAHLAGLIAGGAFPSPLDGRADVLTMSTYKTFGGPPGGLVVTNDPEVAARLDRIAYPGLTANSDMARVAALAVAAADLVAYGRAYAGRCVENARSLAAALYDEGFAVVAAAAGYTRTHHVALDVRGLDGGTRVARWLEPAHILTTGIALPLPPVEGDFNGLRLGLQEVTRWGMGPAEMTRIAHLMARRVLHRRPAEEIRRDVIDLRRPFRELRYCLAAPAGKTV